MEAGKQLSHKFDPCRKCRGRSATDAWTVGAIRVGCSDWIARSIVAPNIGDGSGSRSLPTVLRAGQHLEDRHDRVFADPASRSLRDVHRNMRTAGTRVVFDASGSAPGLAVQRTGCRAQLRSELRATLAGSGVTRFDDLPPEVLEFAASMIASDDPKHARLRRII